MRIIIEYMQLCHIHLYQKIARRKVARVNAALETYRQYFYRFVNLAFDFIKIFFAKIQIAFELFLHNRDSYEVYN